jgi:hypothetical protein
MQEFKRKALTNAALKFWQAATYLFERKAKIV